MSEVRSCPKLLLVTQVLISGGEDEGVVSFSGSFPNFCKIVIEIAAI